MAQITLPSDEFSAKDGPITIWAIQRQDCDYRHNPFFVVQDIGICCVWICGIIILLLGIPYPSSGQSSYYVQCPCCDENPRKKHLNINLKKEVFRCPRCGASGGIFDTGIVYADDRA